MGRVYTYKYDNNTDTWNDFSVLTAPRNFSQFGFSVDMDGSNVIVGANGFQTNQFENKREFDARNQRESHYNFICFQLV